MRGKAVSSNALVAEPTTRREARSSTTAKNNQPTPVGRYVMSLTHVVFTARVGATVKSRANVFGATGSAGALVVVLTPRHLARATSPSACITRASRLLLT